MKLTDFDYDLPENFIAQHPVEPRDSSRLMVLDRDTGAIEHHIFTDMVEMLNPGDVLVLNNTRVIPARLQAIKQDSGGKAEVLLLRQLTDTNWLVIVGGKNITDGRTLSFEGSHITATVIETRDGPQRVLEFSAPVGDLLQEQGKMPLPPYIHERLEDDERYQTVYNRIEGSAAAPTAGLHFTPDLLIALRDKGVQLAYCTLHVGLDTFQPVKVNDIEEHHIHSEYATLDATNAKIINDAKLAGGRIIAVGTTSARTLETAGILSAGGDPANPAASENMCPWRPVIAFEQDTRLFIYPGYRWRVLDGLITNFHLPKSTLLIMISAFAGRDNVLGAYETAKEEGYRFFSFGDAMFIR
ncbi:tRNA preQ1(34) S-adenosylmethionine ribosyltransferase-isomerase QueA [Phototrophicus methaneseepsis]|uniref:S-adenosylmethionine:tRNA ribosyltransferase-isomerase n=1 Tax=Phototrophicus methaneseepsis TaxID=2710758 RepID=A0A7S8ID38_9CHLR|nr:tRNA preQ1(34) S-adenosylmethionine ribosyltransferase-isomerase QueA [Phototrophicus methaneseepsis]QPC81151.1 tRNA preQ1(34) S-adenosylmethionine ribosyltransferase-isomerase QueA [Phototrophicus methaneseepsis]